MKQLILGGLLCIYGTFDTPPPIHPTERPIINNPPATNALTLMQVIDTCAAFYGVPREVIIGVGMSETGLGTDGVGKPTAANNLFGIRKGKYDKHPKDMVYTSSSGRWRKYSHPNESVADFCKFIRQHYHWFWSKPRPLERWLLFGYGNSKYVVKGFFNNQFK
jgi:hypothetical protein